MKTEQILTGRRSPVLLVFLDGVGLGRRGADNPWCDSGLELVDLLGGPLAEGTRSSRGQLVLRPIDACLGVAGLPQSATGQTALFTGLNAPAVVGRHVAAFPGARLLSLIRQASLFRRAHSMAATTVFANAFSSRFFRHLERRRRLGVTVWSVLAGSGSFLTTRDWLAGRGASWDLLGDTLLRHEGLAGPRESPELAADRLLELCKEKDLVLFESFLPDLCGHRRIEAGAGEVVALLDRFLARLLRGAPAELTLVVTSDHGNIEEPGHRRHTRNPVPLLVAGPSAPRFATARTLCDVTPAILATLANGRPF